MLETCRKRSSSGYVHNKKSCDIRNPKFVGIVVLVYHNLYEIHSRNVIKLFRGLHNNIS